MPRTDAAAAPARRVVLFDFDGVLLRGDAFALFVADALKRSYPRLLLAWLLGLPLLPSLLLTRRWLARMCVSVVLLGLSDARYTAVAERFGRTLARQPGRFNREALTALRQHLAAADRVLVVTGCEQRLAQAILDELGLHGMELVASSLQPGALGMRVRLHNIGRAKPRSLAAAGVLPEWDVAYSDSRQDLPMLAAARDAVLVNADPKLCRSVERALGRTVRRVHWR
jgi:phosphatidylglycerophosphatase C